MTNAFILENGLYVEVIGDNLDFNDNRTPVDKRPDQYYDYIDGSWQLNTERMNAGVSAQVRASRDYLLSTEVDPIVSNPLRWGSLSDEQQLAFTVYRQNLLDITEQEGFPHNVTWPTKPEV